MDTYILYVYISKPRWTMLTAEVWDVDNYNMKKRTLKNGKNNKKICFT